MKLTKGALLSLCLNFKCKTKTSYFFKKHSDFYHMEKTALLHSLNKLYRFNKSKPKIHKPTPTPTPTPIIIDLTHEPDDLYHIQPNKKPRLITSIYDQPDFFSTKLLKLS